MDSGIVAEVVAVIFCIIYAGIDGSKVTMYIELPGAALGVSRSRIQRGRQKVDASGNLGGVRNICFPRLLSRARLWTSTIKYGFTTLPCTAFRDSCAAP